MLVQRTKISCWAQWHILRTRIFCSQLCITGVFPQGQSRQWAMHLRRSAQRLKDNLKMDGIKLWLLALQSCIIQFYSHYFLPFHRHQILKHVGRSLMKKSQKVTSRVAPGLPLKLTLLNIIQEKWKENKAIYFSGTEFLENNLSGSLGSKHKSWAA